MKANKPDAWKYVGTEMKTGTGMGMEMKTGMEMGMEMGMETGGLRKEKK